MRFPTLVLLSAALHLYLGLRLAPVWPQPWVGAVLGLALLASAVLVPLGLAARRFARPPASDRLAFAGLLCLGWFSSMFVLSLARELVLAPAWLASQASPATLDFARWWRLTGQAVALLALGSSLLGFLNARRTPRVVTVDIPIAGLPAALQGFTIAQISDIHVGPTIRARQVRRLVDAVNRLRPDVVAVTGDLVDGPVHELAPHVAPLAGLDGRHGSYFVTGNHEYYAGAAPWLAEVERLGLQVLLNRHVVIEHAGARLVLAGVTDFMAHHFDPGHRSDPQAALAGAPADAGARVLLAHQPRSAPAAAAAGFDLQLSGHTHGGQFAPWMFFVRFQQPFTAGLHRVGRMWVYVSRGSYYWGPPKRLGAPSEITRVRLQGIQG
ncbi:metallophosphoesterase [Ramlibacter tataouinensis]|uniref:Candidate phosphohydrolase n=1 Tax=Ramlibacter tataouinensis (strain ATCC BAA-407 / DSM 14655 / LMG 21543 / TTB310) TaxID=365046 RepID=F5Y3Z5_RAMTT|nr:metallophosphoesterase [Ramlibacter tataouinensis]AEG91273.1 Candidate phosphohydrolase [Ramlibacter tataouinensis TTB310]